MARGPSASDCWCEPRHSPTSGEVLSSISMGPSGTSDRKPTPPPGLKWTRGTSER